MNGKDNSAELNRNNDLRVQEREFIQSQYLYWMRFIVCQYLYWFKSNSNKITLARVAAAPPTTIAAISNAFSSHFSIIGYDAQLLALQRRIMEISEQNRSKLDETNMKMHRQMSNLDPGKTLFHHSRIHPMTLIWPTSKT